MGEPKRQKTNNNSQSYEAQGTAETEETPNRPLIHYKVHEPLLLKLRKILFKPGSAKSIYYGTLVNDLIIGMDSEEVILQLVATQVVRKLSSYGTIPLIERLITNGVIKRCVDFLSCHENSALQFEASKILTTLTSWRLGHATNVVNHGAIPNLVKLLKSPSTKIAEQVLWSLGNIARDCPEGHDLLLEEQCMPIFLNLIESEPPVPFAREIARAISNLCIKGNSPPSTETAGTALTIFHRLLPRDDCRTYTHVCEAVEYLTRTTYEDNSLMKAVVKSGILAGIVPLFESPNIRVVSLALKIMENILTESEKHIALITDGGGMKSLRVLLEHENLDIVKSAALIVRFIFCGSYEQMKRVIDERMFLPLYKILVEGSQENQGKEALAIANLVDDGSIREAPRSIQERLLEPFCRSLAINDDGTTARILNQLLRVLNDVKLKTEPKEKKSKRA